MKKKIALNGLDINIEVGSIFGLLNWRCSARNCYGYFFSFVASS